MKKTQRRLSALFFAGTMLTISAFANRIPKIATVKRNGVVTGVSEGTAIITANNSLYSKSIAITVKDNSNAEAPPVLS